MRVWGALWLTSSWIGVPLPPTAQHVENTLSLVAHVQSVPATVSVPSTTSALQEGIASFMWLAEAKDTGGTTSAPSKADVQLLRQAFAEFYGVDRDLAKSEALLSQVITLWEKQPPDERAALYRVRGDCYTLMADADKAAADYDMAVQLLENPGATAKADPSELPAALLGRARAYKAKGSGTVMLSVKEAKQAAADYERSLKLSSREEWDTDQELLEDGATRNPYAAWEWGTVLRRTGDYKAAGQAHALAAQAFTEIGDKARAVMSLTDAGIDYAAANYVAEADSILTKAIAQTAGVESRDVALLQRVIAKEGEGRMALAALLWNEGDGSVGANKARAESILGDACVRLEQMQAQTASSKKGTSVAAAPTTGLRFSMDDALPAPTDVSCYRFRNPAFLDQLGWSEELQKKVIKLENLR